MIGEYIGGAVVILLVILILAVLASCIKIVPQAQALIVERLGAYIGTWSVGLHFKLPIVDRVARRVNLKEQVVDFTPQPVITKDNVTMQIDTVVFFQITDPKLYAYGVENPLMAIENLTATTLRNIIGDLELDETLTSRETDQHEDAYPAGCGHRSLGHQSEPRGAEEHHSSGSDPGCHGEADEGGA